MKRLGTPENAKEGIVIDVDDGGRRITLRGWHSGAVLIRPRHFSIEEIAHALGLLAPVKKRGRRSG
ncbi:MAG: hypothetical protein A2Z40_04100 [Deltaproteobacteria bacterium RBG_19FT_COMBO_60_16]|nr:MAG: hypothetical protein A2Z40_04100 [Deltaproteobacteria bacterium RBG_19FT_COMBO_60_16]